MNKLVTGWSVWDALDKLYESKLNEEAFEQIGKRAKLIDKTVIELLDSEEFKNICYDSYKSKSDVTYKTKDNYLIHVSFKTGGLYIDDSDTKRVWRPDLVPKYVTAIGVAAGGWNDDDWNRAVKSAKESVREHEQEMERARAQEAKRKEDEARRAKEASDKRIAILKKKGIKLNSKSELPVPNGVAGKGTNSNSKTPLYYDDITVSYAYGSRSWDDGSYEHEGEDTISGEYEVPDSEILEVIGDYWEEFMPDDLTGDEENLTELIDTFLDDHYEELLEVYEQVILDYFRDSAEEDAQENYDGYLD